MINNNDLLIKNYKKSLKIFNNLKEDTIIMDVVYQPEETNFIKIAKYFGFKTLSGKRMNLLQAALGFQKAFSKENININDITTIMEKV